MTEDDLNWWLTLAANLEWTFAGTYAGTAPHSYVVHSRTAGMTKDDYVRAAHVIHTFGQPAKFYNMTSIYLTSPDGRLKWWTMDKDLNETGLINMATTERLYGAQNAPPTYSGMGTAYDQIATRYDERNPITHDEVRALKELVAPFKSDYPTSVLDVGCGTGRVLDLGLTTPDPPPDKERTPNAAVADFRQDGSTDRFTKNKRARVLRHAQFRACRWRDLLLLKPTPRGSPALTPDGLENGGRTPAIRL